MAERIGQRFGLASAPKTASRKEFLRRCEYRYHVLRYFPPRLAGSSAAIAVPFAASHKDVVCAWLALVAPTTTAAWMQVLCTTSCTIVLVVLAVLVLAALVLVVL